MTETICACGHTDYGNPVYTFDKTSVVEICDTCFIHADLKHLKASPVCAWRFNDKDSQTKVLEVCV